MTRELTDSDLASIAIDKGDIAGLDAALRRHPELVSTDRYGGSVDYSLLDEAASRGLLDACKLLIEAGASVNRSSARWRHDTPLCGAAYRGHKEVAQLLLNAGADPNGVATTASTPLMASATIGALDLADLLLNSGAELNREAILKPVTALDVAVIWSSPTDMSRPDVGGVAPGPKQARVAEYLLERGGIQPYSTVNTWGLDTDGLEYIMHVVNRVGLVSPVGYDRRLFDGSSLTIRKTRFAPNKYLHQMLFTVGLAERHGIELAVCLPRLWPLNGQSLALREYAWPLELLDAVAANVRAGLTMASGAVLDRETARLGDIGWPELIRQWVCATVPVLEHGRSRGVPATLVLLPVMLKKLLKPGKDARSYAEKKTNPTSKGLTRWAQLELPYDSPYMGWIG